MNNTFNLGRVNLLLKRTWVENRNLFLMASLVLSVLIIGVYAHNTDRKNGELFSNETERLILFMSSLFISGSFLANYLFKDFTDKNCSTSFLMIPASHFEKFLSALFINFVVFPVVFAALFLTIDSAFVSYTNSIITETKNNSVLLNNNLGPYLISEIKDWHLLKTVSWFIFQLIVILGSLSFGRMSYIKTGFVTFGIFLILFGIGSLFNYLLVFPLESHLRDTSLYSSETIAINQKISDIVPFVMTYFLTPFLLIVSYLKLTEKQV